MARWERNGGIAKYRGSISTGQQEERKGMDGDWVEHAELGQSQSASEGGARGTLETGDSARKREMDGGHYLIKIIAGGRK